MGTAGFARVLVRGKRREPAPPPRMMAAGEIENFTSQGGESAVLKIMCRVAPALWLAIIMYQCSSSANLEREPRLPSISSPSTDVAFARVAGSYLRVGASTTAFTFKVVRRDLQAQSS